MARISSMSSLVALGASLWSNPVHTQEANEILLCIPTVEGAATLEGYEGCIELLSTRDGLVGGSNEGARFGRVSERVGVQLIQVIKKLDISSVDFRMAALRGSAFSSAEISYVETGDMLLEFFEVIMRNVFVSDYSINSEAGSLLTETITLEPTRAVWNFYERNLDGTTELVDSFCYDFQSRRTC